MFTASSLWIIVDRKVSSINIKLDDKGVVQMIEFGYDLRIEELLFDI